MQAWNVTKDVATAWINGHQHALDLLMNGLGPEGVLIANGGVNKHTNGFMMETFQPNSGNIRQIQNAASKGLINQVHCNMYSGVGNPDTRDCLAAFLIGAGNNSFFSGPDGWEIRESSEDPTGIQDILGRWRPYYDKPLGLPKSDGVLDADMWKRDFEYASVVFNATTCAGNIRFQDGLEVVGPGCEPGCKVCHKAQ